MAVWAQVHDFLSELMTEDMNWTFGEQLGEVIAVSHRNKVIVDKFFVCVWSTYCTNLLNALWLLLLWVVKMS